MNENIIIKAGTIIANFFKHRREELGYTIEFLAEKTGLTLETLKSAELDCFGLSLRDYFIVCDTLHLFPAIAELESNEEIAVALLKNWTAKPKLMSIEQALKMKRKNKFTNNNQHN